MKTLVGFSILALIWSIYYLAMHITGGILTMNDKVVCGLVITVCLIIIVWNIVHMLKRKRTNNEIKDDNK